MQKEIVIIGGGIAGLTAATQLQDWHITLVEARERFGGRIRTESCQGNIVEAGAEFVHGENKALFDAIYAAHLKVEPVSMRNQVLFDKQLRPVPVWDIFGNLIQRTSLNAPDKSFLSFLQTQSLDELDMKMMRQFVSGFNAADPGRISVHSLRKAEHASKQMEGDRQSRLASGYGSLVEHLESAARRSGANLLPNVVVRTIRWQRGKVRIEASAEDSTETFLSDAAVITLPLGVLKSDAVTFEPALPNKSEAIKELQFGNVVKIILVFRHHWWPEPDFGFIHDLEAPLQTWWSDPRGPVLTGWSGGPKADALLDRSPGELEQLAVETLARLFSYPADRIREELLSVRTHDWTSDPFARGAYSYIPVNGIFLPKQLSAPVENTLFFAGEATAHDAQMGTVFGALESGLRVGREIAEAIRAEQ